MTARLLPLLTLLLLLPACRLADLRPAPLDELDALPQERTARGRALLDSMQQAHGGLATWQAHRNARVTLTDHWEGALMKLAAMPWSQNDLLIEQTMLLGQDTSRLVFLEGEHRGDAWGIQDWATYTVSAGEEPVFEANSDAWFWLPTVEYFFEAPFRLHEAQYVAHAGERELGGKRYELVYLTWGSVAPTKQVDQYVAWIDQETGRLGILQYTVRDFGKFVTGAAFYEDYEQVQGIQVARRIAIADLEDREDVLHVMDFKSIEYGVDVPDTFLRPDPSRKASKQDGGKAP